MVFEFIYGRDFIDWLYPKMPSQNIVGVLRPPSMRTRPPKRILIFGAHHDSALQFNYLGHLKNGYFAAAAILLFGLTLFTGELLLRWLSLVFARPVGWLAPGL
jgi:hypothetical protein